HRYPDRQGSYAVLTCALALSRPLVELPDEVRARGADLGDSRADHLTRRRARRVQPEVPAVGHDAVSLGLGEPHGKAAGPHLVQLAPRGVRCADPRILDDLHELRRERADRLVRLAGVVEDGPGVLRREPCEEQYCTECGMRNAECGIGRTHVVHERGRRGSNPERYTPHSPLRTPHLTHAPTDAGSAIRRPMPSAIPRISLSSGAN